MIKLVIEKLRQFNIFLDVKTLQERNEKKIHDQILATRLYLLLFITSLIVLVLFNTIATKMLSITVFDPSLDTYDRLYNNYPNTLSCTCRGVTMQYLSFISMEYIQHPVCTSDLVSSKWIDSLFNSNTSHLTPLDFRLTAAAQFRLLKAMCSVSTDGINVLRNSTLGLSVVSGKTMSRLSLNTQMDGAVATFNAWVQSSLISSRAPQFIMMGVKQSRIHSAVHTDAFHLSIPGSNQYEAINNFYPRYDNVSYNNDTMNTNFNLCGPLSSATYKAGIYNWSTELRPYYRMMNPSPPAIFIIPGMNVGCTPYDAISTSSLECFFSPSCLNTTAQWISNLPSSAWPKALNSSKLSKFLLNSTIASIMDKQMIDLWNNTVDFDAYYKVCAPTQCTYTMIGSENVLYVINLVVGLVGSLNISYRIIAPLIVQLIRFIITKLSKKPKPSNICSTKGQKTLKNAIVTDAFDISVSSIELDRTSNNIEVSNQNHNTTISQWIAKMKHFIMTFNLFEDDFEEPLPGVYATYIYVILLLTCVTILGVYSLLTIQTHSVTVSMPSLSTFETLHETYSETLNCPCSELTVTHQKMFISSDPVYHQICSSTFLTPVWLDGFFTVNFANESDRRPIPDSDFRKNGMLLFYQIMTLCNFSQEATQKSSELFLLDQYSQAKALSRLEFEWDANVLLVQFRESMKLQWKILVSLLRTSLTAGGYEGGIQFQSIEINGKTVLQRYLPAPSTYNTCACSVARNCPDSTWSGGQFLCYYGNNCTADSVVWSLPGFIKACTSVDTTVSSDLRCFFNRTCLDMLLSMYNVDMPKRQPLPADTLNLNILNTSTLTSFLPTDTIEKISSELMIDYWTMSTNFAGYYNSCAPFKCTYTIALRMNFLYAFTMITAFFGGLVVTFRLFIPIGVRLVYGILKHRRKNCSNINDQTSMTSTNDRPHWYRVLKNKIKETATTMNLFKRESVLSQIVNGESMAIKATRFYTILLPLSVLIIIVFKSVDQTTITETVLFPSLATYDKLQVKYSDTFSCTCQQMSVFYKTFISITPKVHQVCSSDFIKQPWITSLYGYNNSISTYQKLDRPLLSKHFQILALLCDESQKMIDFWTFTFNSGVIVDTKTYSRSNLETFVNIVTTNLKSQAKVHFQLIIPFISEVLQSNLLPTVFNTDWTIEYGYASNGYLTQSVPRLYMNNTCNCVVSNSCQDHLRIGPPDLILPGLVVGCSPIEGLRMSTLECFYSSDCISTIISHLDYYIQMNGSAPNNFSSRAVPLTSFDPLLNSTEAHFLPNTSIVTLINEVFIEDWIKNASYEAYYNACSPSACSYHYTKRQDVLYVTTSLLALYGGLTVGWRFIIWNALLCYQWIKRWCHRSHTIVQPLSNTE